MAKGMRVKLNYEVSRDPDTGVEVTRLTPPEVTCHRNYFYQKCFFNDGSHLLFAGEFDGHWNYYLLDLKNAEAVQGLVTEQVIDANEARDTLSAMVPELKLKGNAPEQKQLPDRTSGSGNTKTQSTQILNNTEEGGDES